MVPAMDRVQHRTRSALKIGLALALGVVDVGCAKLTTFRKGPPPAVLGRASGTTDIYAMNRKPEGLPTALAENSTPNPTGFAEVGMALRPAESTPGSITLEAPTNGEPALAPKPSRAGVGVPNASLVLASADRPRVPKADAEPARIIAEARQALDSMTAYEVSLHRQERVNGTLLPEEDVELAIRRQPKAVRLSWPNGPNQGREVLYRADEPGGAMHVKMANAALPRLTLSPESPMVMRNSRHPVTEAGLDSIVEGLENALQATSVRDLTYSGVESAEGLEGPQPCLLRTSPAGERWRVFFDPATHLPSLVEARDAQGQLLESYRFRDVRANLPVLAAADAFDPDARWGQARGLFGRIARGEAGGPPSEPR